MRYRIRILPNEFSVCALGDGCAANFAAEPVFYARTDEEISLVCKTCDAPNSALRREDGWRAFRIDAELEFSLIGILAEITGALAAAQIGVFAVSTYRTDYIFVKKERWQEALEALDRVGFSASGSRETR